MAYSMITQRNKFTVADNREYKKTDGIIPYNRYVSSFVGKNEKKLIFIRQERVFIKRFLTSKYETETR